MCALEEPFGQAHGACRHCRPDLGDPGHLLRELVGGNHLRDEAPRERLLRVEAPVRAHPLEGPRESEQPVQEPAPTGVRDEADADEAWDEGRGARCHADVAGDRERETRPGCRPVHRRQDGLLEPADKADGGVVGGLEGLPDRPLQLGELAQVLAGAEPPPRAGDDNGAHRGIGSLLERTAEGRVQVPVERVEDVRAVECDREDAALAGGQDLAHAPDPSAEPRRLRNIDGGRLQPLTALSPAGERIASAAWGRPDSPPRSPSSPGWAEPCRSRRRAGSATASAASRRSPAPSSWAPS